MTGLLDTAVLVDLLRAYPPAGAWLSAQDRLGVSPVVWLELLEGAGNLREQARAVELLRHFEKIEMAPEDFDWSIQQALQFRLSHNVDMMDCLIASAAKRLGLLGSLAQKPY